MSSRMRLSTHGFMRSESPPLTSHGAPMGKAPSATLMIFMTPPYCGCSAAVADVEQDREEKMKRPKTTSCPTTLACFIV